MLKAVKFRRLAVFLAFVLLTVTQTSNTFANAAQKQGSSCPKLGAKSGSLVCSKRSGKLIWLPAAKWKDLIDLPSFTPQYLGEENLLLNIASKSGQRVIVESLTLSTCLVNSFRFIAISIGKCELKFSTRGDSKYSPVTRIESFDIRRRNSLNGMLRNDFLLSSLTVSLPQYSSAGLLVDYTSESSNVCQVRGSVIELRNAGMCIVNASQSGDAFTDQIPPTSISLKIMQENKINFSVPQELSLKLKAFALTGTASSNLPVIFRSASPEICAVTEKTLSLIKIGVCSIVASQIGDSFTLPAAEVFANINVIGQRTTEDQPDSVSGFQIKPIYVVPSDGTDRQYDINGYIASALSDGNAMLFAGIGYEFQIDSIGADYDIQFFKSSYSKDFLSKSNSAGQELMKEMKIVEKFGENRKNYVFFIDVDSFKYDSACGYAGIPGMYSVVAVGPGSGSGTNCVGPSLNLKNYVSHTWVHEMFHNLGVDHTTNDPCDLMRGSSSNYCSTSWTIDKERNRYVGSDKQGVNVLSLRVWKGYLQDQGLRASCSMFYSSLPRSDGLRYVVCPTGTQVIGALSYCWSSIRSVELQVWKNNSWSSLGDGNHFNEPWGKYLYWKCDNPSYTAPWKQITVTTPGIQRYRWMVNGVEGEQFNIIWQT